jgi:hypothetical protein
VPVGILNETHEPPTFYGVERNALYLISTVGDYLGPPGSGLSISLAITAFSGVNWPCYCFRRERRS